ncbi:TPA: SpaA isopeptide-forming pilin-related protein [Streptococcus suis]
MRKLKEKATSIVQQRILSNKFARIAMLLSVMVVFLTSYLLVLPALTLSEGTEQKVVQSVENQRNSEMQLPQVQPAGQLTAELEQAVVKVNYEAGTFDQTVKLRVTPTQDSTEYNDKITTVLEEEKREVLQSHSFDISFLNELNQEIEPQKEVKVSLTFKHAVSGKTRTDSEWRLYHFKDNDVNNLENLTEKTEINKDETGNISEIEFSSSSFSNYSFVEVINESTAIYARKDWNEFDGDNEVAFELQALAEDGTWKTADVENAIQTIEVPVDSSSTPLVWNDVKDSKATYRVLERAGASAELTSESGSGSEKDPFVLVRKMAEGTPISEVFLRSAIDTSISGQTGSFTLKKVDENKKPLSNATFTLYSANGDVVQQLETTSSVNGIVFSNIPEGVYTLKETKAPDGYQLLDDYYEIKVNQYGVVTTKYIDVDKTNPGESGNPSTGTGVIRQPKTENVVTVLDYSLTSTRTDTTSGNLDAIWMTSGEFVKMYFKIAVKPGTLPGDSFTLKLDDKMSPTGIRERILPPYPLKIGNEVVATARYDETTNSFIYTFTDYIVKNKNVTLEATYSTLDPDVAKVLETGQYTFSTTIDNQKQPDKTFYVDYGAPKTVPGPLGGQKLRNFVTSVNRLTGTVERTIYLNSGRDKNYDYVGSGSSGHVLTFYNQSDSTIVGMEVYRVLNSQKAQYMPDSMPGIVDGLEKLDLKYDSASRTMSLPKTAFHDSETGWGSSGLIIKITEKLSSPVDGIYQGGSDISVEWYHSGFGATAGAAITRMGASSSGSASALKSPVLTVANIKQVVPTTTTINVNKQWLNENGDIDNSPEPASITYNLKQIATTDGGERTERIYLENQVLSATEQWRRSHRDLPVSGTNDKGEKVQFTYYVEEISGTAFEVSYSNSNNVDTKVPLETAIKEGDLTIKNKKRNVTSITINKQWFTADNQQTTRVDGNITYDLKQVSTNQEGQMSTRDYLTGEVLNHNMNWTKTYDNLPKTGVENGENVTYSYFVVERKLDGYMTSYSTQNNPEKMEQTEQDSIASGIITIKNTATKKYVLPETGGNGTYGLNIVAFVFILLPILVGFGTIIKRYYVS